VETFQIKHFADIDFTEIDLLIVARGFMCIRRERNACTDSGSDQIGFGKQNFVGKTDLTLGFFMFIQLLHRVTCIDHGDHRIQHIVVPTSSSTKKVCATGPGLARPVVSIITRSKSISPAFFCDQITQCDDQVAAHGAADAAVVHFHDLLALSCTRISLSIFS
jgi:hypothetical protein